MWESYKLSDLLEIQNGYAFNSKQFASDGEMPLIRIRDLKEGIETETKYTGEYDEKHVVHSGDFLIGMDGEFGCYEWKGSDALLNQRVCRLESFSTNLLPRFLFYGINKYLKDIEDVTTFTTVKHISAKQIKNIVFPLPPLEEQKRIVAILDEAFAGIDQAIANTEQNIQNARELFEGHLNTIFTKKGEGWEEKKLVDLIAITHGYAFKGPDFANSNDATKPIVLTPGNYSEAGELYFTEKNTKRLSSEPPEDYLFDIGDLTVVMTDLSSKMKILGKPAFINHVNILHNQRIGRIIFKSNDIESRFLYNFLRTRIVSEKIKETATGTMVRHTAPKRILDIDISFPKSLGEQARIVECLKDVELKSRELVAVYEQKLTALKELKQSLLQKAFAGDLTSDTRKAA